MKKLALFIAIVAGIVAKAQTLEKDYSVSISYAKVGPSEGVYFSYAAKTKTCNIYNMNHNLIKTVIFQIADTSATLSYVTKILFNSNPSDYEFMATAGKNIYVIGDDGTIIKTISAVPGSTGIYGYIINTVEGVKLNVYHYMTGVNPNSIYSLPGQLFLGKKELSNDDPEILPYPNPADNYVFIPEMKEGLKLEVFSNDGREVGNLELNANVLNIDRLPSGGYYYNVSGKYAGKFIKQ